MLERYLKTGGFGSIRLETVERYNSLRQLRNILSRQNSAGNVEEVLKRYIFPENEKDEEIKILKKKLAQEPFADKGKVQEFRREIDEKDQEIEHLKGVIKLTVDKLKSISKSYIYSE